MLLLAIETATDVCSVAVFRDGRLLTSSAERRPRIHAERLVPMIGELLGEAEAAPGDLDIVALSAGPGSYTGLRIGAATAKGMLFATGAQLVAVSTLEALAWQKLASGGPHVAAVLPSRRGECYLGAWRARNEGPFERLLNDSIVEFEHLFERLSEVFPDGATIVVPDAEEPNRLRDTLRASLPASAPFRIVTESPSAESVGRCAAVPAELQLFEDVTTFEPYYLRDFEARKPSRSIFDRLPF
jgi:tRNA threonylcarbamoyladenosine biosynthesis protein TsaB